MYEGAIQDLIDELGRLPGVGPKSAQRIAFHILSADPADVSRLATALRKVKELVRFCVTCYNVSEAEQCKICRDPRRTDDVLCVVEEPKDAGTDWPTPAKPGGNAPEPPPAPSPPAQAAAPRRRVEKKAQDESWPDEPPFDPEYDPPPAGGALYEGFDPGDEPMDDAAGPDGTRQSSEEQAIALLKETLGAEKIGDAG